MTFKGIQRAHVAVRIIFNMSTRWTKSIRFEFLSHFDPGSACRATSCSANCAAAGTLLKSLLRIPKFKKISMNQTSITFTFGFDRNISL